MELGSKEGGVGRAGGELGGASCTNNSKLEEDGSGQEKEGEKENPIAKLVV